MYFQKVPKVSKGVKRLQKVQKVTKSAKKCKKGPLYQCLLYSWKPSKHHNSQIKRAREMKFLEDVPPPTTCHMSLVMCQMSCVMRHVSGVTCHSQTVRARDLKFWEYVHLPPSVTCQMSHVLRLLSCVTSHSITQSGWASWWRVCYERANPV